MAGCAGLPEQPDVLLCSFYYQADKPVFLCNRVKEPSQAIEIPIEDVRVQGAKCMPLDSFEKYTGYVYELRRELIECRIKK